MADRSHLSIGEVLSLLQDEFPDLTITKIRFLEGQGLIAPERTPSGYRKFYEPDIERLRWILHQQRENFLPLKVIKDRLDEFGGAVPPLDDRVPVPGQLPLAANVEGERPAPVWMSDHAKAAGHGAEAVGPEAIPGAPPEVVLAAPPRQGTPTNAVPPPAPVPAAKPPAAPTAASATSANRPPAAPTPKKAPMAPADAKASPPKAPAAPAAPVPPAPKAKQAPPAVMPLDTGPSGMTLTFDELLGATGLNAAQARSLEQFGLLEAQQVADEPVYTDDAVVVARKAAVFFRYGLEPRHLRAYKVAADREAGLLEQLILPLLKQRNPTSRRQAVELLSELATQGQGLHAAFLRQALREHLTPRT